MAAVAGDGQVLTLAAARQHLRVGDELRDEDLALLVAAAEGAIVDYLGRAELVGPSGWLDAGAVPANVVHAVKLVATDLYDNRNTPLADMTAVQNLAGRYVIVSVG